MCLGERARQLSRQLSELSAAAVAASAGAGHASRRQLVIFSP